MKNIITDSKRVFLRTEPVNEIENYIKKINESEDLETPILKSIVMVENEKVGYLTLTEEFNNVLKINMNLAEENVGLGIGTRTMEFLHDKAKKWDSYLITEISKENQIGNRLFQRKGTILTQNNSNNLYVLGNNKVKKDFIMEGYLERYLNNKEQKILKKGK